MCEIAPVADTIDRKARAAETVYTILKKRIKDNYK